MVVQWRMLVGTKNDLAWLWHHRLGHIIAKYLRWTIDRVIVIPDSLRYIQLDEFSDCDICAKVKSRLTAHNKNHQRAIRIHEIVHSDILGPLIEDPVDEYKYVVSFIDNFSNYCVFVAIRTKLDVYNALIEYISFNFSPVSAPLLMS